MPDQLKERLFEGWRFIRFLARHFIEDNCQSTAAALTYQTLFAVVPLITVLYAVVSAFDAFQGMGETVENFIFANIVPENVATVQEYIRSFSDQARNLSVLSAAFLAVTVFLMLFTIEGTFNDIWRVKEPRQGFDRLLMYWAVLTLAPILVLAGLVVSTYLLSLPLISDVYESPLTLRLLPLILSAATFTLIYVAIPNTLVPLKHAVIGGILVAVFFETAKFGFGYVMGRSNFEVIYGTFAVVPLFLIWIYVSWTIVLVGAELVKALGVFKFEGDHQIEDPLFQVLIILEMFYRAHQRGEVITEKDIRQQATRIDLENWTDYRQQLVEMNLIRPVEKGGLVLSRDLGDITVWQLYDALPWKLPTNEVQNEASWEIRLSTLMESIESETEDKLAMNLESLFNEEWGTNASAGSEKWPPPKAIQGEA